MLICHLYILFAKVSIQIFYLVFIFLLLSLDIYILWIEGFIIYMLCNYFLSVCGLFILFKTVFWIAEILNFGAVQFIFFFLLSVISLVLYMRNLHPIQSHKDFLLHFLIQILSFSVVYLGLLSIWNNILYGVGYGSKLTFYANVLLICLYWHLYLTLLF